MALKRKKVELSHAQRWNAANARAAKAIAAFEDAINCLDDCADEHAVLAHEIDAEMLRLDTLRQATLNDYDSAVEVADKLRALVGKK